jgi:cation transport ATPase
MTTPTAHRLARRILLVFGFVWLAFNIAANTGSEWQGPVGLLVQCLLAAPFFALAWLGVRRPRTAGALLLALAAFCAWFFGLHRMAADPPGAGVFVVLVFFVGPLVAAGVLLLRRDADSAAD